MLGATHLKIAFLSSIAGEWIQSETMTWKKPPILGDKHILYILAEEHFSVIGPSVPYKYGTLRKINKTEPSTGLKYWFDQTILLNQESLPMHGRKTLKCHWTVTFTCSMKFFLNDTTVRCRTLVLVILSKFLRTLQSSTYMLYTLPHSMLKHLKLKMDDGICFGIW